MTIYCGFLHFVFSYKIDMCEPESGSRLVIERIQETA